MKYVAQVGLDNDKTKKRFEAGDTVADGDFPVETIKHWLRTGRLKKASNKGKGKAANGK